MDTPEPIIYIKPDHQELLVEECVRNAESIREISQIYLSKSGLDVEIERMTQFVILAVLCIVFGLLTGTMFTSFSSPGAGKVREYIESWTGNFPGQGTVYLRLPDLQKNCWDLLEKVAAKIQDAFYVAVGNHARAIFTSLVQNSRTKATPPLECFIGIASPSQLFPSLAVAVRGRLLPFFHAWLLGLAGRVTSTAELIGRLKTVVIEGNWVAFKQAGEAGFFHHPPGKNAFYTAFQLIEARLAPLDDFLNRSLANLGAIDLTAVTVDTSHLPADKRDQTATPGTSSRGPFHGHKTSTGGCATGIPVSNVPGLGRQADSTLFKGTYQPMVDLAKAAGQDMWVSTNDAAYSSAGIVNTVEGAGTVCLTDINPKNSPRLADLKSMAGALADLSKKAIEEGLSKEERKAWLGDAQAISRAQGKPVPLAEKKKILPRILRKYAERARMNGLTQGERRTEKRLRREVGAARRELQYHGTSQEKKVGLPPVVQGTIEWFLCYHIRGQNEGIFSLLKKRGATIGDGQRTPWVVGQRPVHGRVQARYTGIKVTALVMVKVTGTKKHFMRVPHN